MTQAFEPMYFTPHPVIGAAQLYLPLKQRNTTGDLAYRNLGLPKGVNRVMMEWSGTKNITIRFNPPEGSTSSVVKTLQPNESWSATFPCRADGGFLWFSISAASEEDAADTLAVTVIPGPAYDNTAP